MNTLEAILTRRSTRKFLAKSVEREKLEKSIGGISSIVIVGQSVLSGMWFPIEGLNEGMITFMKILPFKNATTIIQNMILGVNNSFDDFILPLLIVLAYTILSFILAILMFKYKMKEK